MPGKPRLVGGNGASCKGIRLGWAYANLKCTGRGKHVGRFSYYHRTLAEECDDVLDYLEDIASRVHDDASQFNVIKLDAHSRLSFLRYEDFAHDPLSSPAVGSVVRRFPGKGRKDRLFGARQSADPASEGAAPARR